MTFTLAMIESPHVWKRAQMDIDAVVGMDRLPEFDDRPSLPYVDAIVREVLRWRPAFPIGQCCKASVLSDILLSILKVYRTRLRKVISTRATTYLKACPTCVFSLLVALNVAPGAMVIPNVWYVRHTREDHHRAIHYSRRAMSRDEARYSDADKFMPERFLDAKGILTDDDPADFVFGFGRRICPG